MSNNNFHSELHKMVQNPEYQEGAIKVHFLSEDQKVLGYVYMHKCHIRELDKEYYDVYCSGIFGDNKFGFTLLESENVECFTEYLEDFMVYKDTSNSVKINLTEKSLKKYIVSTRFNHNFYDFDMDDNSDILLLNELPPLIYEKIMNKYSNNVYAVLDGLSNEIKMKWLKEKNFSLDEIIKFVEPIVPHALLSQYCTYNKHLSKLFQKVNCIEQNLSSKMALYKLLENKISPESKLIIDDYLKKNYLDGIYLVGNDLSDLNKLQEELIKYFKIEKNAYCMKVLVKLDSSVDLLPFNLLNKKICFCHNSDLKDKKIYNIEKPINKISIWSASTLQTNKIKVEFNVYSTNKISIDNIWYKKCNDNLIIAVTQIFNKNARLKPKYYATIYETCKYFDNIYLSEDEEQQEEQEE